MASRGCKDCPPDSKRPAPFPGPRCATHNRAKKKADRERAHELRVQKVYGLLPGEYAALYELQDGRCFICQRATGTGKRKLAVDHDHVTNEPRGLLCSLCNKGILGHCRDSIEMLQRAIDYLSNPPYGRLDK